MVFGSPHSARTTGGSTPRGGHAALRGWSGVGRAARARARRDHSGRGAAAQTSATWCRRSRKPPESCARSAVPAIQTMFDTHNAVDEVEPHAALVDKYFDVIRHVHVNEMDGGHPGTGYYDFRPVLRHVAAPQLRRAGFRSRHSTSSRARRRSPTIRCAISKRESPNFLMSKYVVTGGAGFIGSALVRGLLRQGARKSSGDRQSAHRARGESGRGGVVGRVCTRADIRCYDQIAPIVRGADVVFHEAAIPSVPRSIDDPVPSHEVNIDGTFQVLRACADGGVKRVVYAASSSAYGDTRSAAQGRDDESRARDRRTRCKSWWASITSAFSRSCFGLETVALRYFNVFGPAAGPVQPLFRRAVAVHEVLARAARADNLRRWRAVARFHLRRGCGGV